MVSAEKVQKNGYIAAYDVHENGIFAGFGGLDQNYFLYIEKNCPYKELVLRALIDYAVKNLSGQTIYAKDEWDADLTKFGFTYNDNIYTAKAEELCLPRCCG